MSDGDETRKGFRRGRPPRSAPGPEAESTGGPDRDRPDRQPRSTGRGGTEFRPHGGGGAAGNSDRGADQGGRRDSDMRNRSRDDGDTRNSRTGDDRRRRDEVDRDYQGDRPRRDADRGNRGYRDPRGGDRNQGNRGHQRSGDRDAQGDRGPRASGDRDRSGADRGPRNYRDNRGGAERDTRDRPRRGGEGRPPQDRRPPRPEEPDLPEEISASDLDGAVRRDLLSLDKGNADTVARHLVMVADLLEDDPRLALAHARAARNRAGRIAVVRETAGVAAYHAGEWAEALSELRAARRMSGGPGLLAVMADCERGLGRPERAIELGRSDEARALDGDAATELRIVLAGARMDLGQIDRAIVTLQTPELDASRTGPAPARLFYAYADALLAAARTDDALTWFLNAAAADLDGDTDAEDRVAELSEPGAAE